jgi:hypothetical protein
MNAKCGTLRKRRLPCVTCHRSYPFAEESGKPPTFDFGGDEPPTPSCRTHKNDSLCLHYVATRRTASAADLALMWSAAGEIAWVTFFRPFRELSLADAQRLSPDSEAAGARRLISESFQDLSAGDRANFKGVGAVELGLVEMRYPDGSARRLVVVHVHLLAWGIPVDRVRRLLRPAVVKTEIVLVPLQVQTAHHPERPLGYTFKHVGDHRTQVRGLEGKRFERLPEGEEARVQQHWCAHPAREAEVLIGLRRHTEGRITAYSRNPRHFPRSRWSR